jgi:hypothetical protein
VGSDVPVVRGPVVRGAVVRGTVGEVVMSLLVEVSVDEVEVSVVEVEVSVEEVELLVVEVDVAEVDVDDTAGTSRWNTLMDWTFQNTSLNASGVAAT